MGSIYMSIALFTPSRNLYCSSTHCSVKEYIIGAIFFLHIGCISNNHLPFVAAGIAAARNVQTRGPHAPPSLMVAASGRHLTCSNAHLTDLERIDSKLCGGALECWERPIRGRGKWELLLGALGARTPPWRSLQRPVGSAHETHTTAKS